VLSLHSVADEWVNTALGHTPVPVPLCPPKIPHILAWDRTWACLVMLEAEWVTCVRWVTGLLGRGSGGDTSVMYSGRLRYWLKARGWYPVFELRDITLESARTASCFISKILTI